MDRTLNDLSDPIGCKPPSEGERRRGCRRPGCFMIGLAVAVCFFVFGFGHGLPATYWLRLSEVQIFEGPEGVVLFVEVERLARHSGFIPSRPMYWPGRLVRIDVSPTGLVRRTVLGHQGYVTFNTNVSPAMRINDTFYLVKSPSLGHPNCRLQQIDDGWVRSLSVEESESVLGSVGIACGSWGLWHFENLDRVSEKYGYRRLNGSSYMIHGEGFVSPRHRLRIRVMGLGQSQAIMVESLTTDDPWNKTVERVSTRRWRSY